MSREARARIKIIELLKEASCRFFQDAVPKSGLCSDGLAAVVANLSEASPGEFLQLQGHWDRHQYTLNLLRRQYR